MPSVDGEVVATTRMSPGSTCSTAACTIMLSPGALSTVTADPAIDDPCWMGEMDGSSRPRLPLASWTVATPACPSPATT